MCWHISTFFFCRSFENNWNIYKILAFQKPVKTEVAAHAVLPPSWMKKTTTFSWSLTLFYLLRPTSPWPFSTWEPRLQAWTLPSGLRSGWHSYAGTRSTAFMTASKDSPEDKWVWTSLSWFCLMCLTAVGFVRGGNCPHLCCVQVFKMDWHNVAGWTGQGGSLLGTKRWGATSNACQSSKWTRVFLMCICISFLSCCYMSNFKRSSLNVLCFSLTRVILKNNKNKILLVYFWSAFSN